MDKGRIREDVTKNNKVELAEIRELRKEMSARFDDLENADRQLQRKCQKIDRAIKTGDDELNRRISKIHLQQANINNRIDSKIFEIRESMCHDRKTTFRMFLLIIGICMIFNVITLVGKKTIPVDSSINVIYDGEIITLYIDSNGYVYRDAGHEDAFPNNTNKMKCMKTEDGLFVIVNE